MNYQSKFVLNLERINKTVNGQTILITGGTGSFGQKLIKILFTHFQPKKVIVFSRDEFKQHIMLTEFGFNKETYPNLYFAIGDVRNYDRIYQVIKQYDVNIVVHTAAIKHVTFAELNPDECILTNVIGTSNLVKACQEANVNKVLALSTDKCVDPINLYGATKLCLERLVIMGNNFEKIRDENTSTRFAVARYGNVLGSRGSIVHVFQDQCKSGQLKITHPDMTRFTLLKEEAVTFALNSLAGMLGGEVFVPILPSYNIGQLAQLIGPNLPHIVTGIRPGEKVAECMISRHESYLGLEIGNGNDKFYIIRHHHYQKHLDYVAYYQNIYGSAKELESDWSYSSDHNGLIETETLDQLVKIVLQEDV